jgi:hypothetical protein
MVDRSEPEAGHSEHPVAHLQNLWRATMGEDAEA